MKFSILSHPFISDGCLVQPFRSTKAHISVSHLKYVEKGKEVYNEYYGLLLRCSSIFDPSHKEIMFSSMVE